MLEASNLYLRSLFLGCVKEVTYRSKNRWQGHKPLSQWTSRSLRLAIASEPPSSTSSRYRPPCLWRYLLTRTSSCRAARGTRLSCTYRSTCLCWKVLEVFWHTNLFRFALSKSRRRKSEFGRKVRKSKLSLQTLRTNKIPCTPQIFQKPKLESNSNVKKIRRTWPTKKSIRCPTHTPNTCAPQEAGWTTVTQPAPVHCTELELSPCWSLSQHSPRFGVTGMNDLFGFFSRVTRVRLSGLASLR